MFLSAEMSLPPQSMSVCAVNVNVEKYHLSVVNQAINDISLHLIMDTCLGIVGTGIFNVPVQI